MDTTAASLTPVERRGEVWVKRDDLCAIGDARGGKARTVWALAQGASGLVTTCGRQSVQALVVAQVAKAMGIPAAIHTAGGKLGAPLALAQAAGATIVQHRPGYLSQTKAAARRYVAEHGHRLVPFGLECDEAVQATRPQVANLPAAKRLVVPIGGGMTLSSILWGLSDQGWPMPVVGVAVGGDPRARLDKFAPPGWAEHCKLYYSSTAYTKPFMCSVDGLVLDPYYEAKCVPFLHRDDCLWVIALGPDAN